MSGSKPIPPPVKVALVAWSGDASQLACRLNMNEDTLTARLKRLAQGVNGSRLVVVEAIPTNSGPIIAALSRLLQGGAP